MATHTDTLVAWLKDAHAVEDYLNKSQAGEPAKRYPCT
jgi:hypothetical protein